MNWSLCAFSSTDMRFTVRRGLWHKHWKKWNKINAMWKKDQTQQCTQTIKKQHSERASEREQKIAFGWWRERERDMKSDRMCTFQHRNAHFIWSKNFEAFSLPPSRALYQSISFFFFQVVHSLKSSDEKKNWRFVCQAVLIFIAIKSSFYRVKNTRAHAPDFVFSVCVFVFAQLPFVQNVLNFTIFIIWWMYEIHFSAFIVLATAAVVVSAAAKQYVTHGKFV